MDTTTLAVRDKNSGPLPATATDQVTVLSVDKALQVVELLMHEADPLPARVIAERLGINRTTTHRLLNALIRRGWIEKPRGTTAYRLSLKFLALAHISTQMRNFMQEVRPALERLSRLFRETVHLGVLDGFELVHIDKIDSLEHVGVASKIGTRAVPHMTALGKALFAAGSDAVVEEYLAYGRTRPAFAVSDPEGLRAEIRRTRAHGYSLDDEEDSIGVRCVGVAVVGAGGEPIFAISLTGPSPRFTRERADAAGPELIATARALSLQFGWEPEGAQD